MSSNMWWLIGLVVLLVLNVYLVTSNLTEYHRYLDQKCYKEAKGKLFLASFNLLGVFVVIVAIAIRLANR